MKTTTVIHDPSEDIYECALDNCTNKFKRKHGHSYAIAYATPGLDLNEDGTIKRMYPGYMCEESGFHGQHWACCPEHAAIVAKECIDHLQKIELAGIQFSVNPTLHEG